MYRPATLAVLRNVLPGARAVGADGHGQLLHVEQVADATRLIDQLLQVGGGVLEDVRAEHEEGPGEVLRVVAVLPALEEVAEFGGVLVHPAAAVLGPEGEPVGVAGGALVHQVVAHAERGRRLARGRLLGADQPADSRGRRRRSPWPHPAPCAWRGTAGRTSRAGCSRSCSSAPRPATYPSWTRRWPPWPWRRRRSSAWRC